jgi:hypothetical protein
MRCFMIVVNGFFTISQSLLSTLADDRSNMTRRHASPECRGLSRTGASLASAVRVRSLRCAAIGRSVATPTLPGSTFLVRTSSKRTPSATLPDCSTWSTSVSTNVVTRLELAEHVANCSASRQGFARSGPTLPCAAMAKSRTVCDAAPCPSSIPSLAATPAFVHDRALQHAIESDSPDARYAIVEQRGDT